MQPNRQQSLAQINNLKVAKFSDTERGYSGKIFSSPKVFRYFLSTQGTQGPVYVKVNGFVFMLDQSDQFGDDQVALNQIQRAVLKIGNTDLITLTQYIPPLDAEYRLISLDLEITPFEMRAQTFEIDDEELADQVKQKHVNQFFSLDHTIIFVYRERLFRFRCTNFSFMDLGVKAKQVRLSEGMLNGDTSITFSVKTNDLKLKSVGFKAVSIIDPKFKFEDLGVGGLDQELADIFRKAFASRRFPPAVLQKYGIKHAKGLLLYGPPGCGKTLIAKKLAGVLNSVKPKIVNGPSILSEFIGKAEENIRNLFADARKDEIEKGDSSPLHVIIFDEMDAICRKRGSSSSTSAEVGDKIVNQLLTMIDGPESLNNILVIGMTNMKELIDPAILRAGRFEYHVEIGLPDDKGRLDILKIHTATMFKNGTIDPNINLEEIVRDTKNYTGADIEQLVKVALSYSIGKMQDLMDFSKPIDPKNLPLVTMEDFKKAIQEVKPLFGVDEQFQIYKNNKLINYGEAYERISKQMTQSIDYVKTSENNLIHSILLEGSIGTGKTAIAAAFALKSDITYVKILTPGDFLGLNDYAKVNLLATTFRMAYRAKQAIIVLDEIERIIEYIDEGPRFSNTILQSLLVLIKKIPDKEFCKLLVIGTTSQANSLKKLQLVGGCFNIILKVNPLNSSEIQNVFSSCGISPQIAQRFQDKKVPIKKLLMIIDMARKQNKYPKEAEIMDCFNSLESTEYEYEYY
ncbi:hypothetical protein ABPG74_001471 [Tetrahymena malaccensis]